MSIGSHRLANRSVLAAGTYVAIGLSPFPIEHRSKRPAVRWRELVGKRLIDERSFEELDRYILGWWAREEPFNIGIPTGVEIYLDEERTAPLVVVDVDEEAARQRVELACGWPVITPTVRTGKGYHLWFTLDRPVGNRAKVADVGLDVRGLGGYVLAPPSVHPDGHAYEWVIPPRDLWPPTPMPRELAELIWPPRPKPKPRSLLRPPGRAARALEAAVERVRSAPEGTRNDTLNRAAYSLARFVRSGELSAREVGEALLAAALGAGLPQAEAERTIISGLRGGSAA